MKIFPVILIFALISSNSLELDYSFAHVALSEQPKQKIKTELSNHPVIPVIKRHLEMNARPYTSRKQLIDRLLSNIENAQTAGNVLKFWEKRAEQFKTLLQHSRRLLLDNSRQKLKAYFIVGYQNGIAVPPDSLVMNVAHPSFQNDPMELGYLAVHEAHHVGFMSLHPPPKVDMVHLTEPANLIELIKYFTQLEGMAVHSVYEIRKQKGALQKDPDYSIYTDSKIAEKTIKRFKEIWVKLSNKKKLTAEEIGSILESMSSKERLWYRFGALVCWHIEKHEGIDVLKSTITKTEIFWKAAQKLLGSEAIKQ
jgi:hypothetical protein